MIDMLPEWLQIFLLSMVPGVEAKIIVPVFALYELGWEWWAAFPIGIAGNMILVPVGLLFFNRLELTLRRYDSLRRFMDWFFSRVRNRASKKVELYENIALLFFVAVPLPLSGAGLGVVLAYIFDFKFTKSFIMIFVGVLIATSITTFIYLAFEILLIK